jgi:hypothetical protein
MPPVHIARPALLLLLLRLLLEASGVPREKKKFFFGETLEMRERERNAKGLASTATRGAPRWKKINEKSRNEIEKKKNRAREVKF